MKPRTLILTALAVVALAIPATSTARMLPVTDGSKLAKLNVTKTTTLTKTHKVVKTSKSLGNANRQLCICVIAPVGSSTYVAPTVEEQQAAYDADMVAHGLEPVYSTAGV